jgi:hypothetical protein
VHFPDLDQSCQIARGPRIRAVGWLDAGHAFARGRVDERVAPAIELLAAEGWVHVAAAGVHTCELCESARDGRNVLVPAPNVLYVAPAMVVHYMRAHEYLPPAEFTAAVLACPAPPTDAYYAALKRFVSDLSSPHFELTEAKFDRFIEEARARRAKLEAERAAASSRKGFTWD